MVGNDAIQAAIVSRLKADAPLLALLGVAAQVKESQWQGRDFTYPAVRVAITLQVPLLEWAQCDWSRVSLSIFSMSENDSSLQAEQIASAVNSALHKKSFNGTGFRFFFIKSAGLASAVRMSERVWRSEAAFIADLFTI